jgi:hypothetical protein
MKETLNNKIVISILILFYLTGLSCSSSKDSFRNPYLSQPVRSPAISSGHAIQTASSQQQAPEWIYAVSKDFIVGYGSGKDFTEAKNAALNDIKAFIVKSLGETGNVVEVNFVSNTATGRNNSESIETYLMKNQFESKFTPVVNVSIDRFENYYYEKSASSSKYYIKYRIDSDELRRIKDEYNASVQRRNLIAERIHHNVDSLITLNTNSDLESIIERYNSISDFFYNTELDERDSLKLLRGLQNIRYFLNTVQIRILEHDQGNYIRFGLFNSQIPVRTSVKPSIVSSGIIEDSLFQQDGIWELKYRTIENLQSPGGVEISYSLPQGILTTKVNIPKAVLNPAFEIIDKIHLLDLQRDAWNGIVKNLTIRMNINYNKNFPCTINSIELILHNGNTTQSVITADNLKFILAPGVNSFAKTIKSDLPMRLFLTREMNCDLILYYRSVNNLEKFQINNIPLTINK